MTWLLVLQIVSSAPPLSPTDAARIVTAIQSPANATGRFVCTDCDGPRVVIVPSADRPLTVGSIAPLSRQPYVYRAWLGRRGGR